MSVASRLVILTCLLVSTAGAEDRLVPSEYPTIQAAITAAEDGDTVIVAAGTYLERIDFLGKAITVRSERPDSWQTVENTIVGSPMGSAVTFTASEGPNSVLDGLTLSGGNAQVGGGVYCQDSSPTIRRCNITYNQANHGGGIALMGTCRALIVGCFITANRATGAGGGIVIRAGLSELPSPGRGRPGLALLADRSSPAADPPVPPESRIVNCTIIDNDASGQYQYEVDCWSTQTHVVNTIIDGPDPSLLIADAALVSHSCVKEAHLFEGQYNFSPAVLDLTADAGNISVPPRVARLVFGQSDPPYHLLSDSPCIDAGDRTAILGEPVDIDGQQRVIGKGVDIGADEVAPRLVVTQPSGGELWTAGSTHDIRWDSQIVEGTVDILLSLDAGGSQQMVAEAAANTGSLRLPLPDDIDSNDCIVWVVPSTPDPNVIVVQSGSFTIHPDAVGPDAESKWPSLGGHYARAGLSQDQGPLTGAVKWTFETGSAVVSSLTAGSDGRIHVACENGKLYTLDPDGAVIWVFDVNSPLLSAPSIGPDGSLFVGSQDGKLYAIDPEGRRRWTQSTGDAVYSSAAIAPNGNVYVGSTDGTLYALGPDGTERWQLRTHGPGRIESGAVFASPSIGIDGTVYVAGLYDPNLYALDPETGTAKWTCSFESGGWPFASPVVGQDGTIYQTLLYDSHLYAIEPDGGTLRWSTDLADVPAADANEPVDLSYSDGWSEPVIGPDGTIYVSLDDPYLRAVDPSGSVTWVTRLGDVGAFTLTVDKTGLIYAASDDGSIYVVDSSGALVNRFDTGGGPAFPVITADNTLIVTDSRDYSLLITDAKSTVWAISPAP